MNAKLKLLIKNNNIRFKKANKARRRVMVAKDVIARVQSDQYKPQHGVWANVIKYAVDDDSAQCQIMAGATCQCCALGGLMLSTVVFKNNVRTYSVPYALDYKRVKMGYRDDAVGIRDIFTPSQLDLIEYTFEGGDGLIQSEHIGYDMAIKAFAFRENFINSKDLLVGIMNNIVKNKGEFIP